MTVLLQAPRTLGQIMLVTYEATWDKEDISNTLGEKLFEQKAIKQIKKKIYLKNVSNIYLTRLLKCRDATKGKRKPNFRKYVQVPQGEKSEFLWTYKKEEIYSLINMKHLPTRASSSRCRCINCDEEGYIATSCLKKPKTMHHTKCYIRKENLEIMIIE